MKRVAVTIGLRPECLEAYKRIHVKLWPEIAGAIKEVGISNYSIFYVDAQLFGYFEYSGPERDFEARLGVLARSPRMREWWDITEPMQIPRPDRLPGAWWTTMDMVFHLD